MKKILLASAASFAFAGAAAADITFSGSANVGFGELNDDSSGIALTGNFADPNDPQLDEVTGISNADTLNGATGAQIYQNISLTATMSGETDTGLAFGASITFRSGDDLDLDAGDLDYDGDLSTSSFGNIFISGDWGKLTFDRNGLDNLWDDGFSHDIQYDYSFDAFSFSLTYDIDGTGDSEEWSAKLAYSQDAISASLTTDNSGEFDLTLGYQITSEIKLSVKHESDKEENTVTAAYDNGTFDASLAVSDVASEWDLEMGYKMDALTLGAKYGDSDTGDDWNLSAAYDMGGGLTVKAMANSDDAYYVGLAMSF